MDNAVIDLTLQLPDKWYGEISQDLAISTVNANYHFYKLFTKLSIKRYLFLTFMLLLQSLRVVWRSSLECWTYILKIWPFILSLVQLTVAQSRVVLFFLHGCCNGEKKKKKLTQWPDKCFGQLHFIIWFGTFELCMVWFWLLMENRRV